MPQEFPISYTHLDDMPMENKKLAMQNLKLGRSFRRETGKPLYAVYLTFCKDNHGGGCPPAPYRELAIATLRFQEKRRLDYKVI